MVQGCQHHVEADPAEMAERYGTETTLPDWRDRLICSQCGSRDVDMGGDWNRAADS
jgi:Zn finger protein HypA/HybF involved in hydrogenase expression